MTVNRSSMMPPAAGPILFVDDEAELVQAVGSMLRSEFGDGRVKATSVPQRALDWVKQEKPAVLITDVRMPNMTGLELIEKTQAVWGPVPTVVITAYPSEAVTQATRAGSMVYLPKPFSFRSLLDTIRQLEARRPASFRGAISVATLADLLQLYAISGSTGLMVVKSGVNRGEIWFDRGQVVHASSGDLIGFDAFCAILRWPEGSFSWKTKRAETQSIEMSVSELLLEAYRLHDEAAAEGDKHPSSHPPSFAPAAPSEPQPVLPGDADPAVTSLERFEAIDGFLAAAVVDLTAEKVLGVVGDGGGFDIATAAELSMELVRSKQQTIAQLDLDDRIEDILVTLRGQYHLIRPLRSRPGLYFYVALDRAQASLALARMWLADAADAPAMSMRTAGG